MSGFDHAAAAAQVAGSVDYAGVACTFGTRQLRGLVQPATAEGYPVADGDDPRGWLVTVSRAAFGATFPGTGTTVVVNGFAGRVAASPKYRHGSALLEYFILTLDV